jgi:hypothetical protein
MHTPWARQYLASFTHWGSLFVMEAKTMSLKLAAGLYIYRNYALKKKKKKRRR